MTGRMLAALQRLPDRLIAIDEAHCISQWGPSFRPEYETLSRLRDSFPGCSHWRVDGDGGRDDPRRHPVASCSPGLRKTYVHGFDRPNIRLGRRAEA